ncbi:MAG: lytic transglycosylase domain-containing protein [Burkholderiales bacterium]|nr:MAG: lytic transglycosylase domain-containing protein [Burkholderiales bacterium]
MDPLQGTETLPDCRGSVGHEAVVRALFGAVWWYSTPGSGHLWIGQAGRLVPANEWAIAQGWRSVAETAPAAWQSLAQQARRSRAGAWAIDCPSTNAWETVGHRVGVHPAVLWRLALVESGRGSAPWPWTLNVQGRSVYLPHRENACEYAQRLLKNGVSRFDVGVMQVHWHYHRSRFGDDVCAAFDPARNIEVGATILREHWDRTGSADASIARYHSGDSTRGAAYRARVLAQPRAAPARETAQ